MHIPSRFLSWMVVWGAMLQTQTLSSALILLDDFQTDPSSVPRWISRTLQPEPDPAIQSGSVAGLVTEADLESASIGALVDSGGADVQGLLPRGAGDAFLAFLDSNGPVGADPFAVEWVMDVSGLQGLSWSLDLAAMGDYETSDSLHLLASLDGGDPFSLMMSHVDEAGSFSYTVLSGASVILQDPLMVGSEVVDNTWKTFQGDLPGTGETLLLRLELQGFTATTEPLGVDNLRLLANGPSSVPEPAFTGFLMAVGALVGARWVPRKRP